jgi:hypothetical protein
MFVEKLKKKTKFILFNGLKIKKFNIYLTKFSNPASKKKKKLKKFSRSSETQVYTIFISILNCKCYHVGRFFYIFVILGLIFFCFFSLLFAYRLFN